CVTVEQLLHAGVALGAVGIFEATVKAVVSHAVAIAIAWLLMQDSRNLGGQFVGLGLVRVLGVLAPKVLLGKNRRQFCAFRRRTGVVGRNASFLLGRCPLGRHRQGYQKKEYQDKPAFQHDSESSTSYCTLRRRERCICAANPKVHCWVSGLGS